jgi:hypothetical protein
MNKTVKFANLKVIFSILFKFVVLILILISYFKISALEEILESKKQNLTKLEKDYNLNRVSTTVQINYIKKFLGEPVFIFQNENKKQKDYTFVDPDYYVSITTDMNDMVLSYAITTRSKDFNPILKIKGVEVQLGKTTFYRKDLKPNDCKAELGNTAPSTYYESYIGWNGTSYQDYLFGYNDAGYGDGKIVWETGPTEEEILSGNTKPKDGLNCNLPSDEARKKYSINTFGVGSEENLSIGVNRRLVERVN